MTLARRDSAKFDSSTTPLWKRELLLNRKRSIHAGKQKHANKKLIIKSDVTLLEQLRRGYGNGKQRDIATTANERALDRCRQPDFHFQQRISFDSGATSAMATDSSTTTRNRLSVSDVIRQLRLRTTSVDNMKLLDEVGVRDSVVVVKSRARINAPRTDRMRQNYLKHVIEMNEGKCHQDDKLQFSAATFTKCSSRPKIHSSLSTPSQPPADSDENNTSDSGEELRYGPGIVNKLKTKYLSMTLRDNQKKFVRPSISNLRKASSLDNLLDEDVLDDAGNGAKTYQINSVVSCCVNKLEHLSEESSLAGCVTVNFCADLKRTRSMETLQDEKTTTSSCIKSTAAVSKFIISNKSPAVYENGVNLPLDSIVNEDVIIVESSTCNSRSDEKRRGFLENKELPPPDVVKETLKIFENCHQKSDACVGSQKPWKCFKEVRSPVKNKVKGVKPTLYPKPVIINPVDTTRKPIKKTTPIFENGTSSDKSLVNGLVESPTHCLLSAMKVNFESKIESSPRSMHATHFTAFVSSSSNVSVKNAQIVAPSPETTTLNGGLKTSPAKENGFDERNSCYDGAENKSRPDILKPLDTLPVRQVGIIRPLVSSKTNVISTSHANISTTSLTPQEIEKNYINAQKNLDVEKLKVEKTCENNYSSKTNKEEVISGSSSNGVTKPSTLWCNKPWNQQQNTMVFNFKDRKNVPDYIENDGLMLTSNRDRTKRILQESGGVGYIILGIENGVETSVNESSTDSPSISCEEEWQSISGPPSPCNINFEGDNIVINGKSNLRKHPKDKKLRIQFNDTSTTFEYPSEASLLEDYFQIIPTSSEQSVSTSSSDVVNVPYSSPKVSPLSGSSLASYVPSKLSMGETFELGVTKTKCCSNVASTKPNVQSCGSNGSFSVDQIENSDYLKPAAENDNIAWSEESIPDLLF